MIITKTPFRISFAGGGTDLPSYYRENGGCVLSASIDKYMYVTIHPSFMNKVTRIQYSKTEIVQDVSEIKHPIAKQVLQNYGVSGVEVTSVADVPAGTGLASSSAYTVGLINAVSAYAGKYKSQAEIAKEACDVEIDQLGEPIGKQDQYGAALGGLKMIRFMPNDKVAIYPVTLNRETSANLEDNLLMFYTGDVRSASKILEEQESNTAAHKTTDYLAKMVNLAETLRKDLLDQNLSTFGSILNEGWHLKREMANGITNSSIDHYYELGINNGAEGGKLLGAGGGGFLLFYCEREKQESLRRALCDLEELPFGFDYEGTRVIHVGTKTW